MGHRVNKALQRYLEAATGLTNLTKAKAEQIAQQLVRQGEFATDNVGDVVEELLERQRKNREVVTTMVKAETSRIVRAMGLATTSEVERLERQVKDLKRQLASAEADTVAARPSSGAAGEAAQKAARTAAKKTAAKKAKKTAKQTAAKKAKKTAKKTAAKTAKKTAKKSGKSGAS